MSGRTVGAIIVCYAERLTLALVESLGERPLLFRRTCARIPYCEKDKQQKVVILLENRRLCFISLVMLFRKPQLISSWWIRSGKARELSQCVLSSLPTHATKQLLRKWSMPNECGDCCLLGRQVWGLLSSGTSNVEIYVFRDVKCADCCLLGRQVRRFMSSGTSCVGIGVFWDVKCENFCLLPRQVWRLLSSGTSGVGIAVFWDVTSMRCGLVDHYQHVELFPGATNTHIAEHRNLQTLGQFFRTLPDTVLTAITCSIWWDEGIQGRWTRTDCDSGPNQSNPQLPILSL
jgi:hypothetical protein